jgi:hypothetical protein
VEALSRDCLDVRELKRLGLLDHDAKQLSAGLRWPSIGRIVSNRFSLRLERHKSQPAQHIRVSWTRCHLGGWRPWMHCPYCETRVAKLLNGLGGYRCRKCIGNPIYTSQRVGANGRRHFELCKLRLLLNGYASLTKPFPERPSGMHRTKYARMKARAQRLEMDLPPRYRRRDPDYRNLAYYVD